ncbi:MAG: hypothetical protein OEV78_06945 [Spirochaetia bacterium]|nr:hypothetical protein [Spirochaetia bacterium]
MKDQNITTKNAKLSLEDEILHLTIDYKNGITIDDAKEIVSAAIKLSKGEKFLCIMKSLNYSLPSREVRAYPVHDEVAKYIQAIAFIAINPVANIAARFFIKISKPPFPFKLFTDEEEAIKWLKNFQIKK